MIEYKCVDIIGFTGNTSIEDFLNYYGKDGWELKVLNGEFAIFSRARIVITAEMFENL